MKTCVLIVMYLVAFALEFGGVALVALEIAGDIRAAKRLAESRPTPEGITHSPAPGIEIGIGGSLGQIIAGNVQNMDTFRTFTLERLTGGIRRRVLGVVLIVAGIGVGTIANLISVL